MEKTIELCVCMGSACHQKGVSAVLPVLERLIGEHELQARVELKGAFCLGPCVDGIVMQLGDQQILRISPENIESRFAEEILPAIRRQLDGF